MSITKAKVYDFVYKVKAKAIKSVDDRHKILYESAIEKYLALENTALGKGLAMLEKTYIDREAALQIIKSASNYSEHNFTDNNYLRQSIFYTSRRYLGEAPSVNIVWKAWQEEKNKVIDEYNKLMRTMEFTHGAVRASKLLKELGFDITSIEEGTEKPSAISDINKDALFVCGDRS